MPSNLEKTLLFGMAVLALLGLSMTRLARTRTPAALLQLLGAGCLVIVVLTHIAEALHFLPSMGWGEPHSVGHYTDLVSAILGSAFLFAAFVVWLVGRRATE